MKSYLNTSDHNIYIQIDVTDSLLFEFNKTKDDLLLTRTIEISKKSNIPTTYKAPTCLSLRNVGGKRY